MSSDDFRPILAYLKIETRRDFDELAVKVWFDGLQDLPTEAVRIAAKRFVIEDGEWLTLAKIRRLAMEHIHGKLLDHGDAFELVMKAVRCMGSYDSANAMAAMPPIVRLAILQCGGFGVFCDSPPNERNTLRAQFRMVFKTSQNAKKSSAPCLRLFGHDWLMSCSHPRWPLFRRSWRNVFEVFRELWLILFPGSLESIQQQ